MALVVKNLLFQMLAFIPYVLGYVPPPVNVTVVCHNFHNVIYWNYSEPSLRPQFNVKMKSVYDSLDTFVCSNTTLYHCDVSWYTRKMVNSYLFILNATAGTLTNSSDITVSYDNTMDSDVECLLDFPPVDISAASKGRIKVQFPHPLDTYQNSIQKDEMTDLEQFDYHIITDNLTQYEFVCVYTEDFECVAEIPIDEEMGRHCIKINGKLSNVRVSAQQKICTEYDVSGHGYIALCFIIPIVAVCVMAFFISMWLQRKLKSSFSTFPRSMLSRGFDGSLLSPQSETLSYLKVDDGFLPETPQEPVLNETHTSTFIPPKEEGRFPLGVTDSEEFGDEQMSSNEGSGFSPEDKNGFEQEPEKDFLSGYDSCHVPVTIVREEMSPGDVVTGYKT